MKRLALLIVLVIVMVGGPLVAPHTIEAQAAPELSPGCEYMNQTLLFYGYTTGTAYEFWAGETVEVTLIPSSGLTWNSITWGLLGTSISVTGYDYVTYTFTADVTSNISFSLAFDYTGAPTPGWQLECAAASDDESDTTTEPIDPAEPVPGCDMAALPDTAVVGAFVSDAALYYAPTEGASTEEVMSVGKTAWVFGTDESGAFYKIMWGCTDLWVPVAAMGPNFDDVWNGTPLPVTVAE
jgi:hypothetical protein